MIGSLNFGGQIYRLEPVHMPNTPAPLYVHFEFDSVPVWIFDQRPASSAIRRRRFDGSAPLIPYLFACRLWVLRICLRRLARLVNRPPRPDPWHLQQRTRLGQTYLQHTFLPMPLSHHNLKWHLDS